MPAVRKIQNRQHEASGCFRSPCGLEHPLPRYSAVVRAAHPVLQIQSEDRPVVKQHGIEHIEVAAVEVPASRIRVPHLYSFEIDIELFFSLTNDGRGGEEMAENHY